jgi:dihydrofolate reductase
MAGSRHGRLVGRGPQRVCEAAVRDAARTHYLQHLRGFWPKQDPNNAIAKPFNEATKYVVSHEPFEPDWVNTKVVSGDVPAALRRLKAEDGPDMIVWGSGTLIQTLLREKLVDRMHVWTHPVTIGTGKRLFAEGTRSATWKLVKSRVGDAGVIIATYEPAGELVTGTIGA